MEDLKFGTLILAKPTDETVSPLPLEKMVVNGTVTGAIAVVHVEQRFKNPFDTPIELEYLFPLPEKSAVVDYRIEIGERNIQAEIQEAATARRTYEQAVDSGKRASLMEQRRDNLFSIQIGNVQPGESVVTHLTYEDRLRYSDGDYTFVFPMGITPRYHDPNHVSADEAKSVDRPFQPDGTPVALVELRLTVDAGVAVESPTCPTHDNANLTTTGENTFTVALDGIPNKDFRLNWTVSADQLRTASWGSRDETGETHLITLLPPRLGDDFEVAPREFIFVLDRSGSMGGRSADAPITQAVNALRACIRALDTGDTFTIQAFDTAFEWFSERPQPVTQATVDAADRWLDGIGSRGGTDIVGAIREALAIPDDNTRTRYVVFLTDGAVSAEEEALKLVAKQRKNARIFSFGIGPSVNRALLVKMAELGRGVSEFLSVNEDIEGALTRFQDRVSYPVLFDMQLKWDGAQSWDTYPEALPDLYVGQPLEITTRLTRTADVTLTVTGKLGDQPITHEMTVPAPQNENATINRLWARARVESLTNALFGKGNYEKVRQHIITLGLQHRLATLYTSFVAVDSETVEIEDATQNVTVSGPLPEGLNPDAFGQQLMSAGLFSSGQHGIVPPAPVRDFMAMGHVTTAKSISPGKARKKRSGGVMGLLGRISNNRASGRDDDARYSSVQSIKHQRMMETPMTPAPAEREPEATRNALFNVPIESLNIDTSIFTVLRDPNIKTLADVYELLEQSPDVDEHREAIEKLKQTLIADGFMSFDGEPLLKVTDRASKLREFARTQNVNGSWHDSVEITAAVVLTFVREGHTTRVGNYRRQVKKAVDWLRANSSGVTGTVAYAVKRALAEHDQSALPPAPAQFVPDTVTSLEDLRMVALLHGEASIPPELASDPVAQAWLAVGKPLH